MTLLHPDPVEWTPDPLIPWRPILLIYQSQVVGLGVVSQIDFSNERQLVE